MISMIQPTNVSRMNRMAYCVTFFCALLLLIIGVSCKRTTTTQSVAQQPTASPEAAQLQHAIGGATPSETKYFKGSIGNSLDLQMKLIKTGEQVSGYYSYQKVGTRINLRGTVDKSGTLLLQEFDPTNKQTGEFKGIWAVKSEDGTITIAGNWSLPQGEKGSDKKTAFSVHEEPIFFTGEVEIVNKQIKESNKKLMYEIDAHYPQITGGNNPNIEKLNQILRSFVTKKVAEFRKDMVPKAGEEPRPEGSMGSDINVAYTIALAQDDLCKYRVRCGQLLPGRRSPEFLFRSC